MWSHSKAHYRTLSGRARAVEVWCGHEKSGAVHVPRRPFRRLRRAAAGGERGRRPGRRHPRAGRPAAGPLRQSQARRPPLPALQADRRHHPRRRCLDSRDPLRGSRRPAPDAHRPALGRGGRHAVRPPAGQLVRDRHLPAPDPHPPLAEGWRDQGGGLRLQARQDRRPEGSGKQRRQGLRGRLATAQLQFRDRHGVPAGLAAGGWLRGQHGLHPPGRRPAGGLRVQGGRLGSAGPARRRQGRLLGGDRRLQPPGHAGLPLLVRQGRPGDDQAALGHAGWVGGVGQDAAVLRLF
uniref:PE-PGRS family protein n=1 Tax=Caulobacter sp. (strain K31) TaxID=366602 RepID=B0SWB0_CAUSK